MKLISLYIPPVHVRCTLRIRKLVYDLSIQSLLLIIDNLPADLDRVRRLVLLVIITIIRVSRSHVTIMSSSNPPPRRNHLKVTRSTSNLRLPSVASTAGSPLVHNTEALASSSSSMINVDMSDRILVPEPEADVETVIEQQSAVGQMDATAGDEERKENLRAKLRNTLSGKQSLPGMFRPGVSPVPSSWLGEPIGLIFQILGFGRGEEGGRRS